LTPDLTSVSCPKRLKLSELDFEAVPAGGEDPDSEVTEMPVPFVRGHYSEKDSG
jgi:hypothetical protein